MNFPKMIRVRQRFEKLVLEDISQEIFSQIDRISLSSRIKEGESAAGIKSLARIGDCLAPGTIVSAVFSGHKFAREFDEPDLGDVPFKRERNVLGL